jgi:HSP20 family protein
MAIFRWRDPFESNVFRDLGRLQEEMNTLFERFAGRRSLLSSAGVFPSVNVSQDNDNIYVTAELPGIKAKEIDITIEDDSLSIKGERRLEPEKAGVSYHRRERESGAFNRSITLPTRVEADKVTANSKDGVLDIVLPKAEEVKPKKIDIKVG